MKSASPPRHRSSTRPARLRGHETLTGWKPGLSGVLVLAMESVDASVKPWIVLEAQKMDLETKTEGLWYEEKQRAMMKRGKRDNWRQSHEEEQEQTNTNKSQLLPPLSFHLQQRQQYKLYSDKSTCCYSMQGAGVLSSQFTVSSTQQNTEIESISRRIQQQLQSK